MAKIKQGLIELKEAEIAAVQEKIANNVEEYMDLWKQRNEFLADKKKLKVIEVEGQFEHKKMIVAAELENERSELVRQLDELRAEATRLSRILPQWVNQLEQNEAKIEEENRRYERNLENISRDVERDKTEIKWIKERLAEL